MQVKPAVANGSPPMLIQEPDPQVVPKGERRRFSAEYKQRILTEADRCSGPGQIGALLRRAGSRTLPRPSSHPATLFWKAINPNTLYGVSHLRTVSLADHHLIYTNFSGQVVSKLLAHTATPA